MFKKEAIWREILVLAREKNKTVFTQKELADDFEFSLSTLFNALKVPRDAHIISVSGRNFRLESYQKLLYLWASHRTFGKDILFKSRIELDAKKIESLLPANVVFGLYSAASLIYKIEPADYDHVYIYAEAERVQEIMERISRQKSESGSNNYNFFILKKDPWLKRYEQMPPEQAFVDIWNAPEWYAKDFLASLERKLSLIT